MAILRMLFHEKETTGNKLFFSNKTAADIIYAKELKMILGNDAVFILSREKNDQFIHGKIDRNFLENNIRDFGSHFYVCGPDAMVQEIVKTLGELGASTDALIFEK